ncbi:hypothetical protein [Paenarthrobacter sp. AB444]|nr:hypothetical protein [Paenarthrobacter sp. AB444]MDD7836362.1 hypothetical protein [Paenarthrobacter sp. AB444]
MTASNPDKPRVTVEVPVLRVVPDPPTTRALSGSLIHCASRKGCI